MEQMESSVFSHFSVVFQVVTSRERRNSARVCTNDRIILKWIPEA
jgi:hypothetical protein